MIERFLRVPGWAKLLAAVVLMLGFGLVPMALRWPVRVVIGVLLYTGAAQSLFNMQGRTLWEWVWRPLTHPIVALLAVILVSREVKESFPLSHYPMYSDPSNHRVYLYLAKKEGDEMEPLPIATVCGLSPAKLRRMYRSVRDKYCDEREISNTVITAEDKAVIGEEVLAYMQGRAAHRKRWDEEQLRGEWGIMEVTVSCDERMENIREDVVVMARREF